MEEYNYFCEPCFFIGKTDATIRTHLYSKKHKSVNDDTDISKYAKKVYKCNECGIIYKTKLSMTKHIGTAHAITSKNKKAASKKVVTKKKGEKTSSTSDTLYEKITKAKTPEDGRKAIEMYFKSMNGTDKKTDDTREKHIETMDARIENLKKENEKYKEIILRNGNLLNQSMEMLAEIIKNNPQMLCFDFDGYDSAESFGSFDDKI